MSESNDESLAGIGILSSLSKARLEALEKRCVWRHYEPQDEIVERSSDDRDVYFITRGRARVINYSLSGRGVSFNDLDAGNSFGEIAALDGEPRSANVVALEKTTVASLSPKAYTELLVECPEVAVNVLQEMATIVRNLTDRVMDLSTLGANNRVNAELLRLAQDGMRDDNTAVISPIPVYNDIASRVSLTRETVNRVIADLMRSELVKREKDALVLLDVAQLEAMVEKVRGE